MKWAVLSWLAMIAVALLAALVFVRVTALPKDTPTMPLSATHVAGEKP